MNITRPLAIMIIILGAIAFSGCILNFSDFNWDDYRYRFEDSFEAELEGIETLTLEIRNGTIQVEIWEMDRVEIAIHERIKADDEEEAEELAETVRMVDEIRGDTISLEFDYGDSYNKRKYYAAELEIKLPARMNLSLETTNGKIEVAAVSGVVKARSTNGSIELDGCAEADVSTTNGAISIIEAAGPVIAGTTNGAVSINSLEGPVRGQTTNGKITVEIERPLAGDIKIGTTNGAVMLMLHPESSFEVEASTTNGSIRGEMPGSDFDYNRRRTTMDGRVGDGRYRVWLSTTNGGIRLESR